MMTLEINETLGSLDPIGLDELLERAALQQRIDRKYLLPSAELDPLLQKLAPEARILQIDDRRAFDYESVYFDTPEFTSYHLAARRRSRRFKIRTRTYVDSAECWLEVKTRDQRGNTVKYRREHDGELANCVDTGRSAIHRHGGHRCRHRRRRRNGIRPNACHVLPAQHAVSTGDRQPGHDRQRSALDPRERPEHRASRPGDRGNQVGEQGSRGPIGCCGAAAAGRA